MIGDNWPDVNALGLLTPARNSSYQHPVIEGTLDENGYAKVSIPIELAAHPLNIVVYPPPDWSSVWFNVSSGLQIIGGISSIALACSATLLTGGAATVLSLGLAAWGADQLMTGVNSLVQQQPHKTLMAQGLEQLGASETYAETLTDVVGFANATALANLLVKNSAKLGLSTISISLTERKQQVLLNYISLKTTKLNRKFSLRREQLKSSTGAENSASYPKLKDDLTAQNLKNIAQQDPILAAVIKGNNGKLNYSVGSASKAEADRLGKIWVGDGAKQTSGGGWLSFDGTRQYRPPASKPNTPKQFNPTGSQANFEIFTKNAFGERIRIANGHLVIID